jgi:hypothetical protein
LSGARSDYQIEKQVDSMDLCPLFDKLVARSSKEVIESKAIEHPSTLAAPITIDVTNKTQEVKSSLLKLKDRLKK